MYSRSLLLGLGLLAGSVALPAQGFGAVFTTTNAAADNAVAVSLRLPNGRLFPVASVPTGGAGTGAGLGSQGALAMSGDDQWLLAVNAGSDEVSLFRVVHGLFPWRTDVVPSGGDTPTSVAVHDDLVYVLNAGTGNNVTGFRLQRGALRPLAGATYALSQEGAAGAQVGFDPSGRFLVVTERATDRVDVFPVQRDGRLGALRSHPSSGMTPFGFQFTEDGTLVVSEAAGGGAGAATVSSYRIGRDGSLTTITASAPTMQSAACWIAIPRGGRFAYSTNTGSSTLTGFDVGRQGALTLLDGNGVTGMLAGGGRPIDADFERHGRTLFVLDSGRDEIVAFTRSGNGGLRSVPGSWSLPDGAAGVIAR
ncbi:MAG: beta-propeller fold lactonase family protein [Planctomycetota bacterium]